jgi:hypothetical protein
MVGVGFFDDDEPAVGQPLPHLRTRGSVVTLTGHLAGDLPRIDRVWDRELG